MNKVDLENITSRVALDLFSFRHPAFSVIDNPKSMEAAVNDAVFVINQFIKYVNETTEEN